MQISVYSTHANLAVRKIMEVMQLYILRKERDSV